MSDTQLRAKIDALESELSRITGMAAALERNQELISELEKQEEALFQLLLDNAPQPRLHDEALWKKIGF